MNLKLAPERQLFPSLSTISDYVPLVQVALYPFNRLVFLLIKKEEEIFTSSTTLQNDPDSRNKQVNNDDDDRIEAINRTTVDDNDGIRVKR